MFFVKDNQGQLKETNLMDLIACEAKRSGMEVETGVNSDHSAAWVGIVQIGGNNRQITTNILFDPISRNKIEGVTVYSTPIIEVVDNDNTKQLV